LRRQAQQYGYLQSGPQMQVVDDAGYIDIMPPSGSMYVPVYDPYVVFARPRPGFFVGGAIRFGAGFRWVSGYNRFDWRRHEVFVNRRVWTPPVRPAYVPAQRANPQQRFEGNRPNFTGGNRAWNSNNTAPAVESRAQRTFRPEQPRRDFTRPMEQRSFTPQPPVQHRNMTAPSTMEQRNQSRNHGSFGRGAEGRGRNR